jgi:hypothetical protein
MASGWANDDAVQEQIDSTINDAIARARNELSSGKATNFVKNAESRFLRRADGRWRGQILREVPTGERFT